MRYKGNISCKDGTIKDRNGKDLTEAVLRRGGKNTQKAFMTDNHDGVITQTFWGEKSSGP